MTPRTILHRFDRSWSPRLLLAVAALALVIMLSGSARADEAASTQAPISFVANYKVNDMTVSLGLLYLAGSFHTSGRRQACSSGSTSREL